MNILIIIERKLIFLKSYVFNCYLFIKDKVSKYPLYISKFRKLLKNYKLYLKLLKKNITFISSILIIVTGFLQIMGFLSGSIQGWYLCMVGFSIMGIGRQLQTIIDYNKYSDKFTKVSYKNITRG